MAKRTKSALKANRQNVKRREHNRQLRSKLRTALKAIQRHPDLELNLVVAASALLDRYGNAIQAIERDGFDIAARVYMVLEGENLVTSAKSTGLGLVELATVFDNLRPDAVVTIADRYETLANAVAAAYMNIPVVHVQGGEVTGSIDEKVRHAVTKLSNLHLVSTVLAAERVEAVEEQCRADEQRTQLSAALRALDTQRTQILQQQRSIPGVDLHGSASPRWRRRPSRSVATSPVPSL